MLWNLADPFFSIPFIEQLGYFPFAVGFISAVIGAITKVTAFLGQNKWVGDAVGLGIGALGNKLAGPDRTIMKPYAGELALKQAKKVDTALWGQFDLSVLRGYADDSARVNWKMPELTRRASANAFGGPQLGGGRNYTGLGTYEPYGSGLGSYGNLAESKKKKNGNGNGNGDNKTTWDLSEDDDGLEMNGAMSSSSGFGQSGGTMPGRHGQMEIRGMGGGRESGSSRMHEYRKIARVRDQVARDGFLARGSAVPGGNE